MWPFTGLKYPPIVLYFNDAWLMSFANPYIWRCSTKEVLVPLHQRNIGIHHCDIGCGTGYYLVHHQPPSPKTTITLLDLESAPLSTTETRLHRFHPTVKVYPHQCDILSGEPIPPPPRSSECTAYDSISLTYLLHTLPAPPEEKVKVFAKAKAAIKPSGVVFGATVLGHGPWHSWAGRILLKVLNWEKRLSNTGDSAKVLIQGLRDNFNDVKVDVVGSILVFEAKQPKW
ncbi:hypothetical protein P170DRAFT_463960 [Aspergillus steynii IBT 23096]|uniref:Methyltransferase type 12 domain-containing protein n=1 Tax=Aspergillus steynii IBT 23096 TaxID=1392250 RepID=A0A2I2GDD5_9EURO|nr:uncharacterized protein P170DRAFT_463960 [Aspergillus steynii IBT 23096]PLB50908.1 hypothetical protein P170DRAFT_463960 [Aspergillus steynii IBT 23096]